MVQSENSDGWRRVSRAIALLTVSKKGAQDSSWAKWSWSVVEAVLRDDDLEEILKLLPPESDK